MKDGFHKDERSLQVSRPQLTFRFRKLHIQRGRIQTICQRPSKAGL